MVYTGPVGPMTLEEATSRLREVTAQLLGIYREPGLGERSQIELGKVADLAYEQKCLMQMLAPEHFRHGIGGWWHRIGCTLQREQNGVGAKCRQARELVDVMYPLPNPNHRPVLPMAGIPRMGMEYRGRPRIPLTPHAQRDHTIGK